MSLKAAELIDTCKPETCLCRHLRVTDFHSFVGEDPWEARGLTRLNIKPGFLLEIFTDAGSDDVKCLALDAFSCLSADLLDDGQELIWPAAEVYDSVIWVDEHL